VKIDSDIYGKQDTKKMTTLTPSNKWRRKKFLNKEQLKWWKWKKKF